ncbi:hypothetical protein ACS0TY_010206 [Phlomoides rotata]
MDGSSLASSLKPVKFLCSYGGRILPRYPDGKLRYHGGETRVLSVDVSISFAELMVKMGEICGSSVTVTLRGQLPAEDLDALVSITSDEDLAHLIQEYDLAASAAKMRVFLSAPRTIIKCVSPPPRSATRRFTNRSSRPPVYPIVSPKAAGKTPNQFAHQGNGCGLFHVVHSGNIWQ